MIKHGNAPYLECSSRGDRRFSAFGAKIRARGNRSIEEIYQAAKIFGDGTTGLPWHQAKGRDAVNQADVSVLYSTLWDEYISENPQLLAVLTAASGLSDMFGQSRHACQATELWRIRCAALAVTRECRTERQYHADGTLPEENAIFVFGSNLAGRHGRGAAKVAAHSFGARYGTGVGPTGSAYAIPTKDANLCVLPLSDVQASVADFIAYATLRPDLTFFVTRIGCGLAHFKDRDIALLFREAPVNCNLPQQWLGFCGQEAQQSSVAGDGDREGELAFIHAQESSMRRTWGETAADAL